jgi:hypothetical protein
VVFAAETVVCLLILALRGRIAPVPAKPQKPKLDLAGAGLSALGLGLIVLGILQSSKWGLILPRAAPEIGGTEITPLGFSLVPFMVLAGLAALGGFALWEERRERAGRDRLLDTAMLRIRQLRAGLTTILSQQLVLMGIFFVIPVYLQVVLGFDAFETGVRLLPLSLSMLVAALLGPRVAARRSPRTVCQAGLVSVSLGALAMLASIDVELDNPEFRLALVLVGIGAGLLASQLGNVIMSSVRPEQTSEAGGLQGTALNLGASLGTAIAGAVLIASLTTGFQDRITDNPAVPPELRATLVANTEDGIDIVPVDEVRALGEREGLPEAQVDAVADAYGDAQLDALRKALGAVAFVALLALGFTRRLPTRALEAPS